MVYTSALVLLTFKSAPIQSKVINVDGTILEQQARNNYSGRKTMNKPKQVVRQTEKTCKTFQNY